MPKFEVASERRESGRVVPEHRHMNDDDESDENVSNNHDHHWRAVCSAAAPVDRVQGPAVTCRLVAPRLTCLCEGSLAVAKGAGTGAEGGL